LGFGLLFFFRKIENTRGGSKMQNINVEIPDALQEYLKPYYNTKTFLQKKEFSEKIKDDLEKFRVLYNETYNLPSWSHLPIISLKEAWQYEIVSIPDELMPYLDYIEECYAMRFVHFKNVPKKLNSTVKKYKKSEKTLNKKKDKRYYVENYADKMCWIKYKLERIFMPKF
jgi:hypothetical protein